MQTQKVKKSVTIAEEKKLAEPEDDSPKEFKGDHRHKFSVGKLAKFCKQGRFADRIGAGTPIYLSAVLEYITAEILEAAEQ